MTRHPDAQRVSDSARKHTGSASAGGRRAGVPLRAGDSVPRAHTPEHCWSPARGAIAQHASLRRQGFWHIYNGAQRVNGYLVRPSWAKTQWLQGKELGGGPGLSDGGTVLCPARSWTGAAPARTASVASMDVPRCFTIDCLGSPAVPDFSLVTIHNKR